MQRARLHVDVGLQRWGHVDCIGCRARRRERCSGLGQVLHRVVHPALQQVDVHQKQLIVQTLDLGQQASDQRQSGGVVATFQMQRSQAGLNALAQKGAALLGSPGGLLLANLQLRCGGGGVCVCVRVLGERGVKIGVRYRLEGAMAGGPAVRMKGAEGLTWSLVLFGTLAMLSIMVRTILAVLALGMTAKNGRRSDSSILRASASCSFTNISTISNNALSLAFNASGSLRRSPRMTFFSTSLEIADSMIKAKQIDRGAFSNSCAVHFNARLHVGLLSCCFHGAVMLPTRQSRCGPPLFGKDSVREAFKFLQTLRFKETKAT
jgi:hypothetical protein